MLRNRRSCQALIAALGVHSVLSLLKLPSLPCAFFRLTGLPCPGCGLTRACLLLVQGDLRASFNYHAFAPVLVVFITILIAGTLLPKSWSEPFILKAETLERQTGITVIIMGGLILYWLARLLLFPTAFAQLIRG